MSRRAVEPGGEVVTPMPDASLRVCPHSGCTRLVERGATCPAHQRPSRWSGKQQRDGSRLERGYGSEHERLRKQVGEEEQVCRICGSPDPRWILDHVTPKSRGGRTERANVRRLCWRCEAKVTSAQGRASRGRVMPRPGSGTNTNTVSDATSLTGIYLCSASPGTRTSPARARPQVSAWGDRADG